jgi:membrane-associated phospholipid phosphatase
MTGILKRVKLFLVLSISLFLIESLFLILFSKAEIHLWINHLNSPFFDVFFLYFTNFGSGLFVVAVGIALLFKKIRYGLYVIISWALSGILVQLIKHSLFRNIERPVNYFQQITELHLVEGVKQLHYLSFPSGHSASAFGLFLCLSFIYRKPAWQVLSFCAALLISYSRMYLSQHFLVDIWFGSFLGICCASAVIFYMESSQVKWFDKTMLDIILKKDDQPT